MSVQNTGSPPITAANIISLLIVFILRLPLALTSHLVRRPFRKASRSWKEDLKRLAIRTVIGHLPLSVLRQKANTAAIAKSKRFDSIKQGLFQLVSRPRFSGNWIWRDGVGAGKSVAESDIVIFFIHGGGYVGTDPNTYTTFLMCIAETIMKSGRTVSIFSLDYSFAPEAVFPRQLDEAAAGYDYLINEMKVPSSKVAFLGDSAGGSIHLSLLKHIQHPLASVPVLPKNVSKPEKGVFLVSPWVSLMSETGYSEREESDILTSKVLRTWSSHLLRESPDATEAATYLEFVAPSSDKERFTAMMPETIWVSAGKDELFYENIQAFVDQMRSEDLDVNFSVEDGQPHDWQALQATTNGKNFLNGDFGNESQRELLLGAVEIGQAICGKDNSSGINSSTS